MHDSVMQWVKQQVEQYGLADPSNKILEVGSLNVNGSVREFFPECHYYGIDIQEGDGVDELIDLHDFYERETVGYGRPEGVYGDHLHAYDVIVCTEMLEHSTKPWKAVDEMWVFAKSGGMLLLTTRGFMFGQHNHPNDYTRWSGAGMYDLFEDSRWTDVNVVADPDFPGVFVKAWCK